MRPTRESIIRRAAQLKAALPAPTHEPESSSLGELRRITAERDLLLARQKKVIAGLKRRLDGERARADAAEGMAQAYKDSYSELMTQVSDAQAFTEVQIADAVANYKASADFGAEMEEAGHAGYEYGFEDGRGKAATLGPSKELPGPSSSPRASPSRP